MESFESEASEIGGQIDESFETGLDDSNYELIENEHQESGENHPPEASEVDIKIEEINED